jgi:hypothetical protein
VLIHSYDDSHGVVQPAAVARRVGAAGQFRQPGGLLKGPSRPSPGCGGHIDRRSHRHMRFRDICRFFPVRSNIGSWLIRPRSRPRRRIGRLFSHASARRVPKKDRPEVCGAERSGDGRCPSASPRTGRDVRRHRPPQFVQGVWGEGERNEFPPGVAAPPRWGQLAFFRVVRCKEAKCLQRKSEFATRAAQRWELAPAMLPCP